MPFFTGARPLADAVATAVFTFGVRQPLLPGTSQLAENAKHDHADQKDGDRFDDHLQTEPCECGAVLDGADCITDDPRAQTLKQ